MSDHSARRSITAMPMRAYGVLRGWLGEEHFRLRFQNIGYLFTGNIASGVLATAAFGLAARALGPEEFGILALMSAYVAFVEKVTSFQSGQALIRFGTEALDRGERELFKGLMRFGLLLDMASAVVGTIAAIAFAVLAADYLGWSSKIETILLFYCTMLLFRVQSMPVAMLRFWGRFRFFALEQAFNSVVRLVLIAIGYFTDQGLWFFALAFYVMQPITIATLMFVVWLEARRRDLLTVRTASTREVTARFRGIFGFAWSSNLSMTLRAATMELDTLLVGAFTDTASAGLYHVAKRIGRVFMEVGVQAQSVLYPEVMRFWVQREVAAFSYALRQTVVVLGGLCFFLIIVVLIAAEPLLTIVAGKNFAGASGLLQVQVFASCLYLIGFAIRPALLSTGQERELLHASFWSTVLFQATAIPLLPIMGAMAANIAHIVSSLSWLIGMAWYVHIAIERANSHQLRTASDASIGPDSVDELD